MISKSIINACMAAGKTENKEAIICELINHIALSCRDYNDQKASHILEMLVDKNAFVTLNKVNPKWIESNSGQLMYGSDKYNIRNIVIDSIDNIECTVRVKFEYLEKINEDRDDINYTSSYTDIDFINNPEILK